MKHLTLSIITALTLGSATAQAQTWTSDYVTVTPISGWTETTGTHIAAIDIRLAPAWKTYWRSPGASGIPPQFDWDDGTNVTAVTVDWPQPKVFYAGGERSIGYGGQVILPLRISKGAGTTNLSGTLRMGVCKDICVPIEIPVNIPLTNDGKAPEIVAAIESGPTELRSNATCTIAPITGGFAVSVTARIPKMAADEVTVLELSNPNIWVSDTDTTRRGNTITSTADFVSMTSAPMTFERSDLRLTVFGGDDMVEMRGCTAG